MRKGPGSPCTVISVDFYGRSPESGRLKAIDVLFFPSSFGAQLSKVIVLSGSTLNNFSLLPPALGVC